MNKWCVLRCVIMKTNHCQYMNKFHKILLLFLLTMFKVENCFNYIL